ncbi:hypothetical protein AIIKEEIJ_01014 [Rhodococcus sp. YH1]|nr:hypothetical protein [Rhodococcus sp. YH1]
MLGEQGRDVRVVVLHCAQLDVVVLAVAFGPLPGRVAGMRVGHHHLGGDAVQGGQLRDRRLEGAPALHRAHVPEMRRTEGVVLPGQAEGVLHLGADREDHRRRAAEQHRHRRKSP